VTVTSKTVTLGSIIIKSATKKDNSFSGAFLKSPKFGANSKEDLSKFWTLFRDKGKLRNVAKHVKFLIINIFFSGDTFQESLQCK